MDQLEPSYIASNNLKWCSHLEKEFGIFPKKLNTEVPDALFDIDENALESDCGDGYIILWIC